MDARIAPGAGIAKHLRDFFSNPAFRSAEGSELLFVDNPFHHPLRPNDLSFVDFSRPLASGEWSQLSALMGQRSLLCVFEAGLPLVGERPLSPAAIADREHFYSDENRWRGERIRPFLVQHLFSWVEAAAAAADEEPLATALDRSLEQARSSAQRVFAAISDGAESKRMATLAAIQLAGALQSRELAISRWSAIDWGGGLSRLFALFSDLARVTQRDLLRLGSACGLMGGPHSYWQFYLPTAIGISNYLHRLVSDPRRIDEAIAAVLFDRLRFASLVAGWLDTLAAALGSLLPQDLFSRLTNNEMARLRQDALDVLAARARSEGDGVLRAAGRGIDAMHRLWLAADDDFVNQVMWAGRVDHFRLLARRYMDLINTGDIAVDLETYDEPSSERSTTHVHDTHRLLVIESGEMDFWNSLGAPLHLVPGDMLYVPRHRLHGSVVTSARCVYHQPVINDALARAYDAAWN